MKFYKYQGTGNDFVMIDNRKLDFPKENHALIAQMCHRRFGVGADGLILLENIHADSNFSYDFRMVYYNADGHEGSMCGNGGRCAVKFAYHLGIFMQKTTFLAVDGVHFAFLDDENVHLQMINVAKKDIINHSPGNPDKNLFYLNTGSPHVVELVENLAKFDIENEGKKLRFDKRFNAGSTNVNFVEKINAKKNTDKKTLYVRTYERGVEAETFACGTGVTASALVMHIVENMPSPVSIKVLGGNLSVSFTENSTENQYENIFLIGKAEKIFEGEYLI